MYCSKDIDCCLFECFLTTGIIKLKGIFILKICFSKKIKLLDLRCQTDLNSISGAIYCGAPPAITSHPDRLITQKWSQYFYDKFEDMDGIIWNSANCGMDAIVLNDRVENKLYIQQETEFLKRDVLMKILSFIERYPYHSFNISLDEIKYL